MKSLQNWKREILKRWNVWMAASEWTQVEWKYTPIFFLFWWMNRIEVKIIMKNLFPQWKANQIASLFDMLQKLLNAMKRTWFCSKKKVRFRFVFTRNHSTILRYMPLRIVLHKQFCSLSLPHFLSLSLCLFFRCCFSLLFKLALQNHWLPDIYSKSISIFSS